jgi:ubiquinone/menaquinone biosynthesis C-methylase UbiE
VGLYSKFIFPHLLDWTLGSEQVNRLRVRHLAAARGSALEIGFGTGLNLPHYPERVTALTVIDPERMLRSRVDKRIAASRIPVRQMQLDASGRLPFEDGSFDTVVTTFTLCSIKLVAEALAEMRRVLAPEGAYIFLEHGRSDDARVARRQDLFNPVHRVLACGCNINRPIDRLIRDAGFEVPALDRFLMPDTPRTAARR